MTENCNLHERNINLKIKGVEQHVKALSEMNEKATEWQNEKLEMILEQTIKTNGRVTVVEKRVDKLKLWEWVIDKPHRLIIAIALIMIFSRLITNEMFFNLLLKLFS
jgi:hypothetical protein